MLTISLGLPGSLSAVTLLSVVDIFGNAPSPVIDFPAAFTYTSGAWQYSFAGESVSYNFTYSVTDGSGTISPFNGTVNALAGYQGRYINSTLLNQYLGSINVQIQSDTNSTGMGDALSVQQCIMAAEDECDAVVSNSPTGLQVPISFGTSPINAQLQLSLCQLAGSDLFDKRLLVSATKGKMPPWGDFQKRATDWLKKVWYGDRALVNATYNPVQTAPVGAMQSVNTIGMPIAPNGATWPFWPWWGLGYGAYGCGSGFFGWGYSWWWY
jgi:hypothetical protein